MHTHLRSYLLGVIAARLGDTEAAMRRAVELDAMADAPGDSALAVALAAAVRAHAGRASDPPGESLRKFEQARVVGSNWEKCVMSGFYSYASERFVHAELLEEVGRDEDALRWYAVTGKASFHDIVYLALSHLKRGQIYQRLGDAQKAAEHYRRFLELWANCDEEFRPLLESARQQLAALGGA